MLNFIEIDICNQMHKKITFNILNNRKYNISNLNQIDFLDHEDFFQNHPYRNWYLIKFKSDYIGTLYLSKDNMIGINFIKYKEIYLKKTINFVLSNHEPLPPIKSIRSDSFLINVHPENSKLSNFLVDNGAIHIQSTYKLKKISQTN